MQSEIMYFKAKKEFETFDQSNILQSSDVQIRLITTLKGELEQKHEINIRKIISNLNNFSSIALPLTEWKLNIDQSTRKSNVLLSSKIGKSIFFRTTRTQKRDNIKLKTIEKNNLAQQDNRVFSKQTNNKIAYFELEEKSCPTERETLGFPLHEWPGFGLQLKFLVSAAINAYFYNRTIVIDDQKWNYGKWLYLFKCPMTHCELPDPTKDPKYTYNKPRSFQFNESVTYTWTTGTPWKPVFNLQVPELQHLYTMLEAQRAIVPCLWRLGKKAEQDVNDVLEDSFGRKEQSNGLSYPFKYNYSKGETPEYVGIHVRRGDKIRESEYVPVLEQIKIIENFLELNTSVVLPNFKMPKVFVASDDMVSTLQELRSLRPSWEFFYRKFSENSTGHIQNAFNALPLTKRVAKAIDLIVDIEILRRAKLVACSAHSNICPLLQVLRYAPPHTLVSVLYFRNAKIQTISPSPNL